MDARYCVFDSRAAVVSAVMAFLPPAGKRLLPPAKLASTPVHHSLVARRAGGVSARTGALL